jgi:hypothetical protein
VSHEIDERYAVYRETLRCAAKEHRCDACKEPIAKGHRYYVVTWIFEREADGVKRCLRCQTIHEHLRHVGESDMWPDEKLNCGEEYEEHWGCPPPDEIAALAFATPQELQTRASQEGSDHE